MQMSLPTFPLPIYLVRRVALVHALALASWLLPLLSRDQRAIDRRPCARPATAQQWPPAACARPAVASARLRRRRGARGDHGLPGLRRALGCTRHAEHDRETNSGISPKKTKNNNYFFVVDLNFLYKIYYYQ